jgi:hypothetical protein
MKKYITEEELREWFRKMKEEYKNSPFNWSLQSVERSMFGESIHKSDRIIFHEE